MRGTSHTPGGNEGSFTDGALSLLRNSVGSVSKDYKKAAKPAGKAFQTAHDSSGWDRKARWQRALNLAKSKMGVDGIDESVDKWGTGGRDADGGDHRSASAQPARRGSMIGTGGALVGTPGTIAELRTPVALKEHLKRGKGARGLGIQLVALEGGGRDLPISEQDVAALVAQFDQRRQMLGAAPSPGRPALTPADRALKAWTNNNNNNNIITNNNNNNSSGSDRVGSSSSSLAGNASNSYGDSTPSAASYGGTSGPKAHSCSFAATAAAAAGYSPVCSADSVTVGGIVIASSPIASPPSVVAANATTNRAAAIANGNNTAAAASGVVGGGAIGGFVGISAASFSGTGTAGLGVMLQRRLSENGGSANAWAAGSGGDSSVAPLRRNSGAAPESIIARQPQVVQRGESESLSRLTQDNSTALHTLASPEATTRLIHVSMSGQDGGVLASGASISVVGVLTEHQGGWVPVPLTSSVDVSGAATAGGALRPTPRPSSAGRRGAQSQIWPPLGAATAMMDSQAMAIGGTAGGESSGPISGATSPLTSSTSAPVQLQSQRQFSPALPALQMPPPAAESSSSPPCLPVSRSMPSGAQSSVAAVGGGSGVIAGFHGVEGEPNVRHLVSPSADSAAPSSPGLHLAVTSPIGAAAAAAAAVASTGVNLMPVPPATSGDSPAVFASGLRRPRPRVSIPGENGAGPNTILQGTASGPSQGGWVHANGCSNGDNAIVPGTTATAAMVVAPPPSPRLIMYTSPPSPASPARPSFTALAPGYRRNTASSPGINHPPMGHHSSPPAPALLPSSPPVTLRPHAPGQSPTPSTPAPPSPPLTCGTYRRASVTGSSGILSGGLTRAAIAAPQPYSHSPPQAHASPLQQQQQHIQPSINAAPVWQTSLRPVGAPASPRGRMADDVTETTPGTSPSAGVRVVAPSKFTTNATARTTPVSDAVLAGLRIVATEVADELSREAEVAAMSRQALAQHSRMRMSDSGKPRHISLPGDPWRKWG